jgi:predicted Zn-ribbon and HTH transcriptional regulator
MKCQCSKCGHVWDSRADKPLACPKCKRYDWERKDDRQNIEK